MPPCVRLARLMLNRLFTMPNDDGYQGVQSSAPLTEREMEIAGLLDAIQRAEEAAQNAEDREKLAVASKHRAKARELTAQLNAMRSQS